MTIVSLLYYLPRELLNHIFTCMDSYERSVICTVSKLFGELSLFVSKRLSSYPKYYDNPLLFCEIIKKITEKSAKENVLAYDLLLRDTTHQIIREHDYHLIVRLKSEYFARRLEFACKTGYIPIINVCLIHNKQPLSLGLYGACEGGNLEIVKMMFNKIKTNNSDEFLTSTDLETGEIITSPMDNMIHSNEVFEHAYYRAGVSGNMGVVNLITEHMETRLALARVSNAVFHTHIGSQNNDYDNKFNENDAEYVLTGACRGGHVKLAKWAIERGATDFEEGFADACERDHLSIVKLLFEKCTHLNLINKNTIDQGLYQSAREGHIRIFNHIVEWVNLNHVTAPAVNWSWVLEGACRGKRSNMENHKNTHEHQVMIECAIRHGATECCECFKSIESHK